LQDHAQRSVSYRTLPSPPLVSSIVRRPTSCPCLSPENSSSPWSSSRKNSEEPSRARADGSARLAPFGEDSGGSVRGMIMARRRAASHFDGVAFALCYLCVTWRQINQFKQFASDEAVFLLFSRMGNSSLFVALLLVTTAKLERRSPLGLNQPLSSSYAVLSRSSTPRKQKQKKLEQTTLPHRPCALNF
jgi:hypothetical protein